MSWKNTILNIEKSTYDYGYFCIEDVCRLCWCTDGAVDLKTFVKDSTVAEKILECVSIDTNVFNHPKKLCASCLEEIEKFTEFKRFCQESDRNLRKIMLNDDAMKHEKIKLEKDPNESDIEINNSNSDTFYVPILEPQITSEHNIVSSGISGLPDNTKESVRKTRQIDKGKISKTDGKKTVKLEKIRNQNMLTCYCLSCGLVLGSKEDLIKHKMQVHGTTENEHNKCKRTTPNKKLQLKKIKEENITKTDRKETVKLVRMKKLASNRSTSGLDLEFKDDLTKHDLQAHGITENGHYKCYGCEKIFKTPRLRHQHEVTECQALQRGYLCKVCDKYLPKRTMLLSHSKAHRCNRKSRPPNTIQCGLCLQSFETSDSFKKHKKTAHKKPQPCICEVCGRSFTSKTTLRIHTLVHTGDKPYKCPYCEHRSAHKSSITIHVRRHTKERPYPCDQCPHRAMTASNLAVHKKYHLGIKDFQCKLCEKKYRSKGTLEYHMGSVHMTRERLKSHTCDRCGSSYFHFRHLRRHYLRKHGVKVKKCKDGLLVVPNDVTEGTKDVGVGLNEDAEVK